MAWIPQPIIHTKNRFLTMTKKDITIICPADFSSDVIINNAKENKITICKEENYKLKDEAFDYILKHKNIDVLSTNPQPGQFLGEMAAFYPNISSLIYMFNIRTIGLATKNLLNAIKVKYVNYKILPCSFFIGHMPELQNWENFTEESFLGYPERELLLNSHLSTKNFKFHTEAIYE